MKNYWRNLKDEFFVNYVLDEVKKSYIGADYYLYVCQLFNDLIGYHQISLSGKKILDYGCGTGLPDFYLKRKGAEIHLLDYSKEEIQNARSHQGKLNIIDNIYYKLGNIKSLPYPDNTFDIVWNEGVIEHFDNGERKKILEEMLRVIKPGGALIIMAPNLFTLHALIIKYIRRFLKKFPQDRWGKERAYTLKELGKLLDDLGCKRIYTKSCNLPRALLDDFIISFLSRLIKNNFFNKIRERVIRFEKRKGDFGFGFVAGAIGIKIKK